MSGILDHIGVSDLVDILVMSVLIYGLVVLLKRTRRAASALTGILIVALIYLVALQLDLQLTVAILQGFFAVILIALVVIFQEELRYVFEQIARWGLVRNLWVNRRIPTLVDPTGTIARTIHDLAQQRIGALVVMQGKDLLVRHLDAGEELDGQVGESVLRSLFDPHSIGHDGAVVIEGGLIRRFACHLPLSKNRESLGHRGTRHAAALGLSELTDALCVVASEERGTVSVARHGTLRTVATLDELRSVLDDFCKELTPTEDASWWRQIVVRNQREKLIAVGLAAALWFVVVHESTRVYKSFSLPVQLAPVAETLRVDRIVPPEVEVTLSAPRKSMYFVRSGSVGVTLRAWTLEAGANRLFVTDADVTLPQGVVLENVKPRDIRVDVTVAEATADANGSASPGPGPTSSGNDHREQPLP